MTKQYTKNQHTVPKCYLKNFSDKEHYIHKKQKVFNESKEHVDRDLKIPFSLKKATVVKDFYTVKSGNDPMLVETLIYANEIEDRYPKMYDILTNKNIDSFDMKERTWILTCLLSLHCRTPKQFNLFIQSIPSDYSYEIDKIKEDYKAAHIKDILPRFIEAHQFKRIIIAKIENTSEFITSDNPVIILGRENTIKDNDFQEQFNSENIIFIPLDRKHCFILTHAIDKNGLRADGKGFYNKIERVKAEELDPNFVFRMNTLTIQNADKYCFGSKKYLDAFFGFFRLEE